jgi:hypothetical protein
MDFIRSLFGMLTSSVLRLAVAVGIIAAAYLFIVRPVLDTTNKAIEASSFNGSLNANVDQSIRQSNVGPGVGRQIRRSIRQVNRQVQRQVNISLRQTAPGRRRQKRLLHCVQHAHGNVNRMERCTRRF